MAPTADYRDGHLVVAAIRILEHTRSVPPREEDVAELLQWHVDHARVVVRSLRELGIVEELKAAHEIRLKIRDHIALEELEQGEDLSDSMAREIAEFESRSSEKHEELDRLFGAAEPPKSEKKTKLQKEFESYRSRKPKDPFAD